ncbi:MAG TPA: tRNA (adenosine(37)-N6)-dimethylallyltransferase MiaA [Bacilli bacterium]|nr:tRNA (adenosine(37)-N6)-dimethylallyltransferase MiaA [Bacilli bacterium]
MKIIAIVGPTGVGKTKLSLELAKHYNAEILNCDSMQIYKELNIGTAKIIDKEGIKHHMLDICSIKDTYSVYDYQKEARKILNNLIKKNTNVIIVGGTGLYLKALLYDYKFNIDNKERKELTRKEKDNLKLIYDTCFIGLTTDRNKLYEIINSRVDKMFEDGLLDEVKNLYNNKYVIKAIGYKELYEYINNNITLDKAKELIKQRSRNYAKRQYTWFNNQMDIKWIDVDFNNFSNTVNMSIKLIDRLQK